MTDEIVDLMQALEDSLRAARKAEGLPPVIVPEPVTYVCEACDREFEASPLVGEEPFVVCPNCSVPR